MCFWQEWFNSCLVSGFTGIPKHSVDGWPAAPAGGWEALRQRYVRSIDEAKRIAAESDSLTDALLPSSASVASLAKESRGSALLRGALHNSHHLGQIITMRRLMSLWPPPVGPSRGRNIEAPRLAPVDLPRHFQPCCRAVTFSRHWGVVSTGIHHDHHRPDTTTSRFSAAMLVLSPPSPRPGAAAARARTQAPRRTAPTDVMTVTLEPKPVPRSSEFVATIRSLRSTTVQPQVEGYVRRIFVKAGEQRQPRTAADSDRSRSSAGVDCHFRVAACGARGGSRACHPATGADAEAAEARRSQPGRAGTGRGGVQERAGPARRGALADQGERSPAAVLPCRGAGRRESSAISRCARAIA